MWRAIPPLLKSKANKLNLFFRRKVLIWCMMETDQFLWCNSGNSHFSDSVCTKYNNTFICLSLYIIIFSMCKWLYNFFNFTLVFTRVYLTCNMYGQFGRPLQRDRRVAWVPLQSFFAFSFHFCFFLFDSTYSVYNIYCNLYLSTLQ